jgi:D-tyrosyl-tRNA(Tyr) deacylase
VRAVVQRVLSASVRVGGREISSIGPGLLVLLGISREDGERDIRYTVEKTVNLRIFDDGDGVMNRSLLDTGGEALVVSQFTLYGDTRKGRRPSYNRAAVPDDARHTFEKLAAEFRKIPIRVAFGEFQAEMAVELINDGPVTILIDSEKSF